MCFDLYEAWSWSLGENASCKQVSNGAQRCKHLHHPPYPPSPPEAEDRNDQSPSIGPNTAFRGMRRSREPPMLPRRGDASLYIPSRRIVFRDLPRRAGLFGLSDNMDILAGPWVAHTRTFSCWDARLLSERVVVVVVVWPSFPWTFIVHVTTRQLLPAHVMRCKKSWCSGAPALLCQGAGCQEGVLGIQMPGFLRPCRREGRHGVSHDFLPKRWASAENCVRPFLSRISSGSAKPLQDNQLTSCVGSLMNRSFRSSTRLHNASESPPNSPPSLALPPNRTRGWRLPRGPRHRLRDNFLKRADETHRARNW